MRRVRPPLFATVLLLIVAASAHGSVPPPDVPARSQRELDHASYVELARQWQAYIDENGPSPRALVNLGIAYDYTDQREAALQAARRAVALGPDDGPALALLGKMMMVWADAPDSAIAVLEHGRAVAPDYERGLTLLAAAYLRAGRLDEADGVFKTIHERGTFSRPLQDYAYNMLIGLPSNAVLVTNGDNDTFPPLALQQGMGLRPDVVVLNLSLLNLPIYAEAAFRRHPELRPALDIAHHEVRMVDGKPTFLSQAIVADLIAQRKAPVYVAASVPEEQFGGSLPEVIEGINRRASGSGLAADKAARLFLDVYRLDSATDWSVPWSLAPAEASLISNYVVAMVWAAQQKGPDKATRTAILDHALAFAKFHELTTWVARINKMR